MLSTFTIDTFSTGDIFKVFYGQGQYVEIILVQVSASKYKSPLSKRDPFLLVFQGNKEIMIEAGCYDMEQEKVGSFEMAITPTMPLKGDWESNYYEAAFS
jgi:hypothetical protein